MELRSAWQERKLFDEKFIRLDTRRLCELTSAADSLDMKPLVDLTSRALARMIEGKTPEEIRETFHLPDDLTEVCSLSFSLSHLLSICIHALCVPPLSPFFLLLGSCVSSICVEPESGKRRTTTRAALYQTKV